MLPQMAAYEIQLGSPSGASFAIRTTAIANTAKSQVDHWIRRDIQEVRLTPAILLRRIINNAAGERSEPAATVHRQQQLLVMPRPSETGVLRGIR